MTVNKFNNLPRTLATLVEGSSHNEKRMGK